MGRIIAINYHHRGGYEYHRSLYPRIWMERLERETVGIRVYVSPRKAKPFDSYNWEVVKYQDLIDARSGIFFVKTATLSGASQFFRWKGQDHVRH